ncbi:ABC transporter ATP-binding protein [Brooklawnia sp.]|uniref:ABC transporter ATP-binding protein n=1 Tax=Brooklawnia sp. TaxID=2699740 RepID=UPI00311F0F12
MVAVAELAGVSVRRGTALLLQDVNLRVEEGQRWVVIGPNGAGKTTMLALLSTQMHPTNGVVEILGEYLGAVDVFELRPRIGVASSSIAHRIPNRERVSDVVVSASYGVMGRWREAYEDMDYARALELMQLMHVDDLTGRTYGTLSEGERKRVEIARALMTDPELLLLDEPGAGLDLRGREILVQILSRLCLDPDAPTTVLVTHHVEEIPEGITHALLMAHGSVVAAGPIDEVLTDEKLTQTFEMALRVAKVDGRWTARAA